MGHRTNLAVAVLAVSTSTGSFAAPRADCWFLLSGHACTECPPPNKPCPSGYPLTSCPQTSLVEPYGDPIMVIRQAWTGHNGYTNQAWFRNSSTPGGCAYLVNECDPVNGCVQTQNEASHDCPSKMDPDPELHQTNCQGQDEPP